MYLLCIVQLIITHYYINHSFLQTPCVKGATAVVSIVVIIINKSYHQCSIDLKILNCASLVFITLRSGVIYA